MFSFKAFLRFVEAGGLWENPGQQDNPPDGTKRKNAKALFNHRYGGPGAPAAAPATPKKMKKR